MKIKINMEENKEGNKGQVQVHVDSLFFTKYDMYANTQKWRIQLDSCHVLKLGFLTK